MLEISSYLSITDLKIYYFCQHFKKAKNAQTFYFWQTVSKRPNLADLAFKKAKWQPWNISYVERYVNKGDYVTFF
jgi:hypothetical protein